MVINDRGRPHNVCPELGASLLPGRNSYRSRQGLNHQQHAGRYSKGLNTNSGTSWNGAVYFEGKRLARWIFLVPHGHRTRVGVVDADVPCTALPGVHRGRATDAYTACHRQRGVHDSDAEAARGTRRVLGDDWAAGDRAQDRSEDPPSPRLRGVVCQIASFSFSF